MIYLNGIEVTKEHFPNGELNLLLIEDAISAREGYVKHHIVMKYENDSDLMALYFVKQQLDIRTGGDDVELSIAYMPYSRMDRAETPLTPFMLRFAARFVNQMNFSKVYVHEAHSAITLQELDNCEVVYDNVEFIEQVKAKVNFNPERDYIVFPDKGAYERYDGKISSQNMLFGEKVRDFGTGNITGLELMGDCSNIEFEESTAIIVDDLSSYGGTFIRVGRELYALGFRSVVLLVCHAENSIFKGDLFRYIDEVYTTDSILSEHNYWENNHLKPRLHVFNLMEQLKEGSYK